MIGANAQAVASRPELSAWVGASAGTGKTKVLADRVLRLLLTGTAPERILCLTFTRAAAAEMSNRIHRILGEWVRSTPETLASKLYELLESEPDEVVLERARSLFLSVLDAPGGIRIQTIHSFCESVLGRFPLEADIAPHFEVMDERTAQETLRSARDQVIGQSGADFDDALALISTRLREDRFDSLLITLSQDRHRVLAMPPPQEGAIYRYLKLPPGQTARDVLTAAADDAVFDGEGLDRAAAALANGSASDCARANEIEAWIGNPDRRIEGFASYTAAFLTQAGTIRARLATRAVAAPAPDVLEVLHTEAERLLSVRQTVQAVATAEASSALARLAGALLDAYDVEKRTRARLDYDDLVLQVRRLLQGKASAAWVLYKLDGGIDHVLIDEAQDTSPDQWSVIGALVGDFFAGHGAREAERTVFAVGDPKQSIFSFQGADPASFTAMRDHFRGHVEASAARWETVALDTSFRSTAPVLQAVDAVFADVENQKGLGELVIKHKVERLGQAGEVVLWPPAESIDRGGGDPFDPDLQSLIYEPSTWRLAHAMAQMIANWISSGERLPSRDRAIRAGDVLVLVRRRNEFVEQLVRALKDREVGVAGIDRLVLSGQLAIMDLLALGEAALLPDDDLTMAAVLKGPLFGISEDTLFQLAHGREKRSLFARLAELGAADADLANAYALLAEILSAADFVPPFEFYMRILSGMNGRARILARLGPDAEDPIDEFLNLALDYEREHPPSLQGFVSWFRAATTEVKRDMEHGGRDEVRIMTVHGAKGLEAPVVMLADTISTPGETSPLYWPEDEIRRPILLWRPPRHAESESTAVLRAEAELRRDEEYRRLLYVAMTRAQDQLHVCGFTTARAPSESCWYRLIERALEPLAEPFVMTLAASEIESWSGRALRLACPQSAVPDHAAPVADGPASLRPLPDWTGQQASSEAQDRGPARPSRLDDDPTTVRSPFGADGGAGFRRGRAVHELLRALPEIATDEREVAAAAFLARPALGLPPAARTGLVEEILAVIEAPEFAPLFGPGSLAEVPIAGRIGGRPFSGRIDRLLVGEVRVDLIDYKTDREPPDRPEEVASAYLRQLAAYRGLLAKIYPDRPIRCAVIWTVGPRAMTLPAELLDANAP